MTIAAVLLSVMGFRVTESLACEQKAVYKNEIISTPEVCVSNNTYYIKVNDKMILANEIKDYASEGKADTYRVEIGNWYSLTGKVVESKYTLYIPQEVAMLQ